METGEAPLSTLRVGVLGPGGVGAAVGELTLSYRKAVLNSWPARRQLAVHDDRCVIVIRPRINPFGRRTLYALNGPYGAVGVRAILVEARQLREAFIAAGFELDERRTLFVTLTSPPFWTHHSPGRRRA